MTTPEREKFEKWVNSLEYYPHARADMWYVWQAALSAAPTPPVMDKRTGLSAMILRSVCEAERANPDDDQNICISVDHLQIILDNQIAEFIPTPPDYNYNALE